MTNNTLIAIDKSKSFRVYLTNSISMVNMAAGIHGTLPTASAALGRTLTGAGLMGLMLLKDKRAKLTVQFKGDGPAGEILATADETGKVKGYISNALVDLPLGADGKLDVGGALGLGTLTVIRDTGQGEPYLGRIDMVTGEIADDLTAYFFISEQQSTSVALGVKVSVDGSIQAAGGMIIQMLPDAAAGAARALEMLLAGMTSFSDIVEKNQDIDKLCTAIFKDMPDEYALTPLEYRSIDWKCDCSIQRLEKVLISLGQKDLGEIIEEDRQAELVCQFCRKKYHFDEEHLKTLLQTV